MRLFKACLLIAFLLGAYGLSYAQTSVAAIHGKVADEKHQIAEAATVILLSTADSSIVRSTVCNDKGMFTVDARPGKYLLLISKIGYDQSLTGPYIMADKDITVKDIDLTPHIPQLKEVSITAQRSYVEFKSDRIVLNVQNSIVSEGNSAIEILRQAPTAHVDARGNISLIGRQNAMITIDNKPVNLTGQQLTDYLQGMPGSTIQKVELIANPSAKYEAAGAGIINIVLKKGSNAGTNFTVSAGAGYGKFYKDGAGLHFNNRMGIVNIFGAYYYIENKSFHTFTNNRVMNFNGATSEYDVNYYADQLNKNHNFRLGTDITIAANHTLGFLLSGTFNKNDYIKNNLLNVANQGVLDSTISTMAKLNRKQDNVSYDVNYTGILDTNGKVLSADLVFNNINRTSSEYINNQFKTISGSTYRPPLYLQNLSPAHRHILSAKVDYVSPLSKTSELNMGLKYSWVESNNDLIFGPKVNGVYTSSPQFSNTFNFTENINSAYINYVSKYKRLSIVAGLRAEQTNSKGQGQSVLMENNVNKSYLDLFPQLQLSYQANDKNEYSLNFSRGITRPDYDNINPFLYYADLYDYKAGNPNLLPQYTYKLQLSHTYNKTIVTSLYANIITDFYDFVNIVQNEATKVNISTTQNFGTYSSVGIRFNTPVVFTPWWDATLLTDLSYQRIKAYPANGDLNKGTICFTSSTTQNFKISNTISGQIVGKYESPTFYGLGQFRAVYRIDAGISKQLFNKNGTLRLAVNDIFNSQRDWETINYQKLNITIIDKVESRVLRLSFTYRFGNISLKGSTKHNTSNEDEQKRAAGGIAGNASSN